MNKWLSVRAFWIVSCVFLLAVSLGWYLRLAHFPETFFFQNDVGRDYLVLLEWLHQGKFPWLGPLNSAIAFNQSPWYFYLLMPLFLITGASMYATTLGWLVMVSVLVGVALWWNRHQGWLVSALLTVTMLAAVYPQLVMQTRVVWNPSFVLPLLSVAYLAFLSAVTERSWRWLTLLVCGAAVGLSVGMHLSSLPALVPLAVAAVLVMRWQSLWLLGSSAVSGLIVFGPNLIFDATHDWQIIRRLFSQGFLQTGNSTVVPFMSKFEQLGQLVFTGMSTPLWKGMLITLFVVAVYETWRAYKLELKQYGVRILVVTCCFVATAVLTVLSPVSVQGHYVFGVASLFFLLIAVLRPQVAVIFTVVLAVFWLQTAVTQQYWTPVPRTYAQLMSCFQTFCAQHPEPIYESVTAGFHGYHYGPEFLYLMKANGCQARKIEVMSQAAERMVVVADQTTYTHGASDYYELGLFGPSRVIDEQQCEGGVKLTVLEQVE